jgi:hypothetical protein
MLHILQNPMDLGTVSQRLESNFYASASAVADDVCLVWHNCRTFNEPGSDVYQSCDELAGFFDQQWKQAKLPPPLVSPAHPDLPHLSASHPYRKLTESLTLEMPVAHMCNKLLLGM